jgi:hypothetical protein
MTEMIAEDCFICKVFQTGKLFSAITQVICTVFGSYSNHLQSLLGEKADFCDHAYLPDILHK